MVNHMYKDTITWNPFKGCLFNCVYCKPSFQRQAKRQKNRCRDCYDYKPHFHPERLNQYLPKDKLIFVCGNGDLAFALGSWTDKIFEVIKNNSDKTFLIQTKFPEWIMHYEANEHIIPNNVIIGTTIETNRNTDEYSDAPNPVYRFYYLKLINHKRKFITHEPIIDFDLNILLDWDKHINPEVVWVGYNSHSKEVRLNEPYLGKTKELIINLHKMGFDVRTKLLREKEG